MKKLNVGCGRDIRKDYINLDSAKLEGVDIVHNVEDLPLPFKNEEFDEILCKDVLEHVDYVPVLKDLNRILKKNGKLIITVPHFTSRNNFVDPTHKNSFSVRTFDFFIKDSKRAYYFDFHFNKINKAKIRFEKGILFFNYLIEGVVNVNEDMKDLYEKTFLSRLFPACNIEIELVK
ncbi:MAG: methyltransferase domain-containing protein [Candidatus Nanoarchaeia archaeon]|nr:methyltransferase domain-containing protein [Candidatus Nanoarchaeia archaeon]